MVPIPKSMNFFVWIIVVKNNVEYCSFDFVKINLFFAWLVWICSKLNFIIRLIPLAIHQSILEFDKWSNIEFCVKFLMIFFNSSKLRTQISYRSKDFLTNKKFVCFFSFDRSYNKFKLYHIPKLTKRQKSQNYLN